LPGYGGPQVRLALPIAPATSGGRTEEPCRIAQFLKGNRVPVGNSLLGLGQGKLVQNLVRAGVVSNLEPGFNRLQEPFGMRDNGVSYREEGE
jgi:hypothetical protein